MDIYNNRDGENPRKRGGQGSEVYTVIGLVLCVFVCVALITNGYLFGTVGSAIVKFILGVFGYAAYPFFLGALIFAVLKLFKKKIRLSKKYILAFALMFLTGILSIHLFTTRGLLNADGVAYGNYLGRCYTGAGEGFSTTTGGGLLSGLLVYPLVKMLSITGASVVFILLFLVATFIACDFLFLKNRRGGGRMDVAEYRDYPVGPQDPAPAPPRQHPQGPEGRPYAEYREPPRAYAERPSAPADPPPAQGLNVAPVARKLYIGNIGEKGASDFETKNRRELRTASKLDILYGSGQNVGDARSWDKNSAKEMLFGRGGEAGYAAYEQPQEEGGRSYLESYEEKPIRDLKSPEAVRRTLLTPPDITDMYPDLFAAKGGERRIGRDANRPAKINHETTPVDFHQLSIDEAVQSGDLYRGIPARRTFGQESRVPPGYEEYLNKQLPRERPPIINGEEFAKTPARGEQREEETRLRGIVTSAEEINDPRDKVVNFKDYSEKFTRTAPSTIRTPDPVPPQEPEERTQSAERPAEPAEVAPPAGGEPASEPIVRGGAEKPEQIRLPADSFTKTVRAPEPEPEPAPDEKAKQEAAAVRKPAKPRTRYNPPPIDLIERRIMDLDSVNDSFNEKARILEDTLEEFKVPAKVASIVKGPTVTRYELEMPRGIPVKRVLSVADDLAMRLESENGVRIEAPIPGKNRLGIEVPNSKKLMVGLREVLDTQEFYNNRSPLAFAVGKDVAGKNIICDLAKMPHLLVAGSTGAGKSVCLNTLIISLLYKASPDDVRIILIDPKQVEFNTYNEMPHLMLREVISDPVKAISALNWAIIEMERRYTLFKAMNANNITSYLDKYDPQVDEKLPYIVIIVDELADLMTTNKREVEEKIQRLVQKSRAAGIHLVLATQRPSVDIITGVIKNNLPSRIAFKVVSFTDSKTILDGGGAENLLGAGDMLYRPATAPEPIRLQGAFIGMDEVENIVRYLKENNPSDFDEGVEMIISKTKAEAADSDNSGDDDREREDPLFVDALRMVMETKQASISYLQRKFSIGYARAGKLIDEMETMGYVSPSDGSKARQVYISPQEFAEKYGELDG